MQTRKQIAGAVLFTISTCVFSACTDVELSGAELNSDVATVEQELAAPALPPAGLAFKDWRIDDAFLRYIDWDERNHEYAGTLKATLSGNVPGRVALYFVNQPYSNQDVPENYVASPALGQSTFRVPNGALLLGSWDNLGASRQTLRYSVRYPDSASASAYENGKLVLVYGDTRNDLTFRDNIRILRSFSRNHGLQLWHPLRSGAVRPGDPGPITLTFTVALRHTRYRNTLGCVVDVKIRRSGAIQDRLRREIPQLQLPDEFNTDLRSYAVTYVPQGAPADNTYEGEIICPIDNPSFESIGGPVY